MKIPFAIDRTTGSHIEITANDRSLYKDCVCPSCEGSVIAKLGTEVEWHFAHAKHPLRPPVRTCDISFGSACRSYILDLASQGVFTQILTPSYELADDVYPALSLPVANAVTLLLPEPSPHQAFDLFFALGQFSLAVHLTYQGRKPLDLEAPTNLGVVEMDLDYVESTYNQTTRGVTLIRQLATDLFERELPHKTWRYHPRESEIRAQLVDLRKDYKPPPPEPLQRQLTDEQIDDILGRIYRRK